MKKITVLGVLLIFSLTMFTGCVPKELRTAKIELGTRNKPKSNPSIDRVKDNLTQAMELYPDNAEVYYIWGWVMSMEDNYEEMDKAFKRSAELSLKFKADCDTIRMMKWDELINQANLARQDEKYEDALNYFQSSIVCWPYQYESYLFGADAAYRVGQNEEAYRLSNKAYEMVPDSLVAIKMYGDMCVINGKFEEALAVYQRVIDKDPTNSKAMFQMANIYMSVNDTSKAIEIFQSGLNIDENNAEGWFDLGLLYFQMKDFCKASESFERVVSLLPDDTDARVNYLLSLVQCGELEKARTELEKFTMENPDNCDGWDMLSQTYLRLKMKKEANQAFKKYEDCQGK